MLEDLPYLAIFAFLVRKLTSLGKKKKKMHMSHMLSNDLTLG